MFIAEYIERFGYPPTVREMAQRFECSVETAHKQLAKLQEQGRVRREANYPRAIQLIEGDKK